MAKTTAICTCTTCGVTFEKRATRRNSKEAESWRKWAEKNITECPSCYSSRKAAEERAQPLTIEVRIQEVPPTLKTAFVFSAVGNSYPRKEKLKAAGYRWQKSSMSSEGKTWCKIVECESPTATVDSARAAYKAEFDNVVALGAVVKERFCWSDLKFVRFVSNQMIQEIMQERLPAPASDGWLEAAKAELKMLRAGIRRPDFLPRGAWECTVYRNGARYLVIGGVEFPLAPEQECAVDAWVENELRYRALRNIILKQKTISEMRAEVDAAAATQKRIDAAIAKLDKPVRPACIPEGRWNGKVYGQLKYGNCCIYIDNEEHKLTAAEFDEIMKYKRGMADYRAAVARIKEVDDDCCRTD